MTGTLTTCLTQLACDPATFMLCVNAVGAHVVRGASVSDRVMVSVIRCHVAAFRVRLAT